MIRKLLIANRGEIAIRIAEAAAELGIATVGVYSEDDATSLHVKRVDQAVALKGKGAAAYLDIASVIAAARAAKCDAIHPGYGFLSENAAFATACAAAKIAFVGPTPEQLALFGDKARARAQAVKCKVPVLPGTGEVDVAGATAFFRKHAKAGVALKAIAGGGGRGMRLVRSEAEIAQAFTHASAEAKSAFGNGALYAERLVSGARHIEIQIVGDGKGGVVALGERECTLQRRSQKIVEMAPSPGLAASLRKKIVAAAVAMAKSVKYRSLGTFEFLVDGDDFFFIEANPRLQVEHTVTEEVWGVDLVQAQLLGLLPKRDRAPRGFAIQLRVNMETMTGGRLGQTGRRHAHGVRAAVGPRRAGRQLRLCGLSHQSQLRFAAGQGDRAGADLRGGRGAGRARARLVPARGRAVEPRLPARAAGRQGRARRPGAHAFRRRACEETDRGGGKAAGRAVLRGAASTRQENTRQAGARVDAVDPLAVLSFGKTSDGAGGPRPRATHRKAPCRCPRRCRARSSASASPKAMPWPRASRCWSWTR